jgi:hypothetical protein
VRGPLPRGALFAVLAVALLHAAFQARTRPLYQVSDEMAYLGAAQVVAAEDASAAIMTCVAPPDGELLDVGQGGKRGFQVLTGLQLRLLCAGGGTELPLFALRAWQALSFPLIALAAWYLAWLVSGSTTAGLMAALLVAVHPVAAKYAGGVTPDAWANAFSAGAIVAGTRLVLGRHAWWDWWLLALWTFAGLLWKDTANVLVAHAAAVVLVRVVVAGRRHANGSAGVRYSALPALIAIGTSVAVAVGASAVLHSPYFALIPGRAQHLAQAPLVFLQGVTLDATSHVGGLLASSVLSLYRPLVYDIAYQAGQPLTPGWPVLVLVLGFGLGLAGTMVAVVRRPAWLQGPAAAVLVLWAGTALLCLLQPSMRQVLLGTHDLHQGRWLLPMLAPAAAVAGLGLRALIRTRAAVLPLLTLACLSGLWLVVLDMVRHYYVAFPHALATTVLFTRPTGDWDVGDARVQHLIERTTAAQDPVLTWSILVLLAGASLWLTVSVVSHVSSASTHA